jgi:hypothetical protein
MNLVVGAKTVYKLIYNMLYGVRMINHFFDINLQTVAKLTRNIP